MSYPPNYGPSGPQEPYQGQGGGAGYGPPPSSGYPPGPPPPKPPSSGGNTVAVVMVSLVAVGILVVIGVVGVILYLGSLDGGSSQAGDGQGGSQQGQSDQADTAEFDGTWTGTLTQYDSGGSVHGYFDVTVEISGGEVVFAEETSESFDYEICTWEVHNATWTDNNLYFEYEVVPEHQGNGCAPTGDADITFHDYGAADITSNESSEGTLVPE